MVSQASTKMLEDLCSFSVGFQECYQEHSDCWKNPVPIGCGTEFPAPLLAVGWNLLSAPNGYPHSFSHDPLHIQSQQRHVESTM